MIPKWKKWMMFGILGMLSLFIISFLLSSSLSSFLLLKLSFFAFLLTGIMMVVFLVASLVTTKNLRPKFRITKNLSRVNRLLFRVSYYCINLI